VFRGGTAMSAAGFPARAGRSPANRRRPSGGSRSAPTGRSRVHRAPEVAGTGNRRPSSPPPVPTRNPDRSFPSAAAAMLSPSRSLLAVCGFVFLCVGWGAAVVFPSAGATFPAGFARGEAGARYRAVIVVQEGDCSARIGFVHVFSRPHLREVYQIDGLLVGRGTIDDARSRLSASGIALPLRRDARTARRIHALGYDSTPYLFLVDARGRIVFATPPPTSPRDTHRLSRILGAFAERPDPVPQLPRS
jgi:hypothetical protein